MINKEHDVVIIGAGIGGLVCGCYLAKAGMKVLIIEKNKNPGGYCRSFQVQNFNFDLCARSLSSARPDGSIGRVIEELKLTERIRFERNDPSDVIVTPHFKIYFWNDFRRTINEFKLLFPEESQHIEKFFNFIIENKELSSLVKITFEKFLNLYFSNHYLKQILALPIFGNVGLPASRVSACSAIILYKELMIDGGYHPKFGMGQISDVLAERFREYGGEIKFSSKAKKFLIKNGSVESVQIDKGTVFKTKYAVSDIDARQTFSSLIQDKTALGPSFINRLNELKPSLSHFILYLGLDSEVALSPGGSYNTWYMPSNNLEEIYSSALTGRISDLNWLLYSVGKDKRSIMAFSNVSFLNKEFWQENKTIFTNHCIKILEKQFQHISERIIYKFAATPVTLSNWTSSFEGASYGWEASPSQFAQVGYSQITPIENLFLCSHWTTLAYGIAGVSYMGRSVANLILRRKLKY